MAEFQASAPHIVEIRTAAPTVLVVVLETAKDETGNPSTPDSLDLDPAKWTVNGARPTAVHRHSVPYDALPAIPGRDDRFPITIHHRIYLALATPLQAGQTYSIATPYGSTSILFDPRKVYCESLKVNVASYSALSTARRAAFGVYMGSGGSLKLDALPAYEVIEEATNKVVLSGTATYAGDETTKGVGSGEHVYHLPLDKVPPGGPYYVSLPSCGRSRSFGIGGTTSRDLAKIAFKGLYHQRCGCALEKSFTEFTRSACHTKVADTRAPWSSDGFIQVPPGMATKPWAGGHHDAGDFDLRPYHTIIARILLTTFEALKQRFKDGQFGLPESGKGVPDYLSEAMWAVLAWENLQITDIADPKFGGVRAGVESSRHPQYGIDSAANDHTGVRGTWELNDEVTALCAGIFAHASRMMLPYDRPRAAALLKRAENAYQYAARRNALGTGLASTVYASCQMYLATGLPSYHETFRISATSVVLRGGSWPNQYLPDNPQAKGTTEDFFSYLLPIPGVVDATIVSGLKIAVFRLADAGGYQEVKIDSQPYSNPATKSVGWGTWVSARLALTMGYASLLSTDAAKKQKYLNNASLLGDHTMGLNGAGRCFMTGPWIDSPRSPLHLDSWFTKSGSSDGVTQDHVGKPKGNVPGVVVYGPSQGRSGTSYERSAMDKLSPANLPVSEDDADAWPAVSRAEFSTWELSVESAALYGGFLYDGTKDANPTPIPTPDPTPTPIPGDVRLTVEQLAALQKTARDLKTLVDALKAGT